MARAGGIMAHIGQADSIDTTHLRLRPMQLADAAAVHRLWTERPMLRWLWLAEYVAPEQTEAVIERSVESFETRGAGLWCAYPRNDDALVGFCGFWFMPYLADPELVLGVGSVHARRGYGRDMAQAMVWHGLEVLRYPRILVDVRNARGAALVESIGFRFERVQRLEGFAGLEHYDAHYYAVDAASFRAAGAPPVVVRGPQPLV